MQRTLGALAFGAAAVLFLAVLAGFAGRWSAALEVMANFRLHLAALAGMFGIVLGLARLRRGAVLAVLAALIAAAGLGPVFEPVERPGTGRPLTLLYANLRDRNPEPAALAAMLRATGADILITSETTRAVAGGDAGLRAAYPYRVVGPGTGRAALRTAIWSKFPLRGGRLYPDNTVAPTAASAVADLGGGLRLGLIGVHFSRPAEGLRRVQAEALGPIAAQLGRPLIVAGDFNAPPWSWLAGRSAEVTGTRILGGLRVTWRGDYPTPFGRIPALWGQQIDHMLYSDGVSIDAVEMLELPGSDHLGLFVRLRVAAP